MAGKKQKWHSISKTSTSMVQTIMNDETVPSIHCEAAEALQDISNTRLETPAQKKRKKTPPAHDFSCDAVFVDGSLCHIFNFCISISCSRFFSFSLKLSFCFCKLSIFFWELSFVLCDLFCKLSFVLSNLQISRFDSVLSFFSSVLSFLKTFLSYLVDSNSFWTSSNLSESKADTFFRML